MKLFYCLQLLVIIKLLPYCFTQINLNDYWCSSCDDPHLKTFDGYYYDFQKSGDFYVLFTDYGNVRVTASFRPCTCGILKATCNCGVHIKNGNSYLFLDTCGIQANQSLLKFYSFDSISSMPLEADCDSQLVGPADETNDAWWNAAGNAFSIPSGDILCAKSSNLPNTYFIKTVASSEYYSIYVKVMLHDYGISCIYIRPSENSYFSSGGLCGSFNEYSYPTDAFELFYWNKTSFTFRGSLPNNGYQRVGSINETELANFWRLERGQPQELVYKELENGMCPCDLIPPPANTPIGKCVLPLSRCLIPGLLTQRDCIHYNEQPQNQINNVEIECRTAFKTGSLFDANRENLLSDDDFDRLFKYCVDELKVTNDILWVIMQVKIGRNWVLDTCAKQSVQSQICDLFRNSSAECLFVETGQITDQAVIDRCANKTRAV